MFSEEEDARSPHYVFPCTCQIPVVSTTLQKLMSKIDAYIEYNAWCLVRYIAKTSGYDEPSLYKSSLILHRDCVEMAFVQVEIFLSKSKGIYYVEVNRMRGMSGLYGAFSHALRNFLYDIDAVDPIHYSIADYFVKEGNDNVSGKKTFIAKNATTTLFL
jgi:hypothetical protein